MIITSAALAGLFRSFSTAFNKGLEAATGDYKAISMIAPSGTGETTYAWLGQFPRMREWLGPRIVNNLATHGYTIRNRTFEDTVEVPRTTIEDDQYGVFGPLLQELGRSAGELPDELVFSLLNAGFQNLCFDGQPFFSVNHPVTNPITGLPAPVANTDQVAGTGTPWFLLDTSRAIKPLIYQERIAPILQRLDREDDENVFLRDTYLYGVRARGNAGFGLWQLAWGSMAPITPDSYGAARNAMMVQVGDSGRLLGIKPDLLVTSPANELAARQVLVSERDQYGASNPWFGTAKLLVTAWADVNATAGLAAGSANVGGSGPNVISA